MKGIKDGFGADGQNKWAEWMAKFEQFKQQKEDQNGNSGGGGGGEGNVPVKGKYIVSPKIKTVFLTISSLIYDIIRK